VHFHLGGPPEKEVGGGGVKVENTYFHGELCLLYLHKPLQFTFLSNSSILKYKHSILRRIESKKMVPLLLLLYALQTMHTDVWHRAAERGESAWLSTGRIASEETLAAKQGGYMSGISTTLGGLRGQGLDDLQMSSETQAGGLTPVATIAAVLGAAAIMLFAWQRSQMVPKHSSSSGGSSSQGSQEAFKKCVFVTSQLLRSRISIHFSQVFSW